MLDIAGWVTATVRGAGLGGVFIVSAMSSASLFVSPVADIFYIPLSVAAGLDPAAVGIVAGTGAALGELVAYGLGRLSKSLVSVRKRMVRTRKGLPPHTLYFTGGRWVSRRTDPGGWSSKRGFLAIPLFAFTPFMDLLGVTLGYLRYNVGKFFLGALMGKVPRCLLIAYGVKFIKPLAWLILIALVAFAAFTIAARRIRA